MQVTFSDQQLDAIAAQLTTSGYLVINDWIDHKLLMRLQTQVKSINQINWKEAGIGRLDNHQVDRSIRSDKIHWIEGNNEIERAFLALMDSLRLGLNRRLFLGLYDYESHFSVYQQGMFYKTHIDALKGKSNRVLSSVLYLNSDWAESDGGQLLIHDEECKVTLESITPHLGTMVMFLSEKFPHQVFAAGKTRYSIAGWFRINGNSAGFIDPAS